MGLDSGFFARDPEDLQSSLKEAFPIKEHGKTLMSQTFLVHICLHHFCMDDVEKACMLRGFFWWLSKGLVLIAFWCMFAGTHWFSRWWFQILFMFTPIWGRTSIVTIFQMGWNHQPAFWKVLVLCPKIASCAFLLYPKDHWTLKTGYFEDPTPSIQVQTLPLEGPRSLGWNFWGQRSRGQWAVIVHCVSGYA